MAYEKYFESSKKGKQVTDYLVKKLGWYKINSKQIGKNFAKAEGGGDIDPSGKLVIPASIDGHYIVSTWKGEPLYREYLGDDRETKPEMIAKLFDNQVVNHLHLKRAIK